MSIPLSIALYLTIWWVVLFAVLPFGVRSAHEEGPVEGGNDPGAPVAPMLLKKAIWTTAIASVVFACVYAYALYFG